MAEPKRIGLRDVRALAPGAIIWDAGKGAVAGFGARRQRDSVAYVLKVPDGRRAAAVAHDRPTRGALGAGDSTLGSAAAAGRRGKRDRPGGGEAGQATCRHGG